MTMSSLAARVRPSAQRTANLHGVGPRVAHDPGDPLITSHCPFCGSGQVVGRSDGTIGCDFCGSAYIVRVQPAFPGMPQMPNGPGAPSDVGPDGGLMDPGAIGPDGLPVGGEMPPGEDEGAPPPFGGGADDGAPGEDAAPPGAPGGGDGPPPPKGDSKKDDSGSKPSSKGKGDKKSKSKKESAYRGFDGQALTEEQYVRHLAATLSGGHPAVMAAMRAEAASRRRRPFARDAIYGDRHEQVRSIQDLRRHMSETHGLADAGRLLTPKLLAYMHEEDHGLGGNPHDRGDDWSLSPDGSRSPGFIARRVTAHEDSLPGDEEFTAHLRDRHPDIAELSMFFPSHALRGAHDEHHFHDPEDAGIGPDASRGPGLVASLPGGTR